MSTASADPIQQLRLLQLADSALAVGATAHSFGLESLVQYKLLTTLRLAEFLADYLTEMGALESYFCRTGQRLARLAASAEFDAAWLAANERLSALKPARENRAASAMMGRRLLLLLSSLEAGACLPRALSTSQQAGAEAHYSLAFGLAGGALELDEDATVLAYLLQTLAGLVSACQRLLPLGQTDAARLLWALKPAIAASAQRSRDLDSLDDFPACFLSLLEWGSMCHPTLHTRLFMS